jgi:hypothetical protein
MVLAIYWAKDNPEKRARLVDFYYIIPKEDGLAMGVI